MFVFILKWLVCSEDKLTLMKYTYKNQTGAVF